MNTIIRMIWFLSFVAASFCNFNFACSQGVTDPSEEQSEIDLALEGIVLDDKGQPLNGARVAASGVYGSFSSTYKAEGRSDSEGRFRLSLAEELRGTPLVVLAYDRAYAPGVASGYAEDKVQIWLKKGTQLVGTVLGQKGKPVSDARVVLHAWHDYQGNQMALAHRMRGVNPEGLLEQTHIRIEDRTDETGRFKLKNVPRDRWVVLRIAADGYAPKDVVTDTGADPLVECGLNFQLFFDGGSVELEPATRLELTAVSKEGYRVQLESAYALPLSELFTDDPLEDLAKRVPVRDNRVSLPVLPPGAQRFWLIPSADSGYLGKALDLKPEKGKTLLEKRVEMSQGAKVIGRVVDDLTNEPIEGATFRYDPKSAAEFKELGVFVPECKSNKKGEFTIIVPPISAHLRQLGRVEGYRSTTYDLNEDVRGIALAKQISPKMNAETKVEFRLKPATRITGQVVDLQGQPVTHAKFAFRDRSSQGGFFQRFGKCDEQGRFEIRNVFAEMSFDPYKKNSFGAIEQQDSDDEKEPALETITFWSPSFASNAVIEVPWPTENQPDIPVKVVLQPASEIEGRLVDKDTGKGVKGVKVTVRCSQIPCPNVVPATSDENGEFVLRKLFPNSEVHFSIYGEYVGQSGESLPNSTTLNAGERLNVGEIPLIVYRDLEKLLEVPDISGLSKEQAFQTLLLGSEKVRLRTNEIVSTQSGSASWQSVSTAMTVATERYGEAILKLGLLSKDADFEFKVLTSFLSLSGNLRTFQAERAKKALLERFLDRPEMIQLLPEILDSDDREAWRQVLERTTNEKLKATALRFVFFGSTTIFQSPMSWQGLSDKQFADSLEDAKRIWKMAFDELGEKTPDNGFRQIGVAQLRHVLKQLETASTPDRVRAEQVVRAIKDAIDSRQEKPGGLKR